MNIKYRLICKRLMEERKKVGVIQYYNVLFIMELMTDKDIWYMEQLSNGIDRMYMKDIHEWCRLHSIEYQTVFVYRKEYPLGANICIFDDYMTHGNTFNYLLSEIFIGLPEY